MYNLIHQQKNIILNDLPKGKNMTNFSILNDLSQKLTFRAFSIKYVLEGCEKYQVNGTNYCVQASEYLLANTFGEGKVEVESKQLVKGLCIDIAPAFLSEVFSNFIKPDAYTPDIQLDDFFNSEEFFENKYHAAHTQLGKTLAEIGRLMNQNPFQNYQLENDFYFTLAENIVADHASIITQLYSINTVKHQTRKELYRKLLLGRAFLENNLPTAIQMCEAAQYAGLSEYHFFRLFKTAFGITPQQYFIQMRLDKALALLHTGNYSVTETAQEVGFADVYSFSKAFKKQFAISPTKAIL
jgi:AraC family transcriptional regulator